MTLKVFAGISLRAQDRIHFGTLVRIRAALAGIQTDGEYRVGEQVEFQLDLTGFDASVEGTAEVIKAERRAEDLNRYLLRIRRMRRSDQALLQEWYEQQREGREPTLLGSDEGGRALDSDVLSQVCEELHERLPAPPSPALPVATGDPRSSSGRAPGRGRDAIRALLQAAAEQAPPSSPDLGGAAAAGPAVSYRPGPPPSLELSYRSAGALRSDWDAQLRHGLILVALPEPRPALDEELQVRILCPPDVDVACKGQVALLHDRGVGVALALDPARLHPAWRR